MPQDQSSDPHPDGWRDRLANHLPGPVANRVNPRGRVAVVRLAGVISAVHPGSIGTTLNLREIGPILEQAFELDHLQAVALVVNSPGGAPTQSALIADRVRQLAGKSGVPVIAFCEDVAASGGYWLACAADEIIAHPTSTVGSIGVISTGFGLAELLDRLGLEYRRQTAGEHKGRLDPLLPADPADQVWLQSHLDELHRQFMDWVGERRGSLLARPVGELCTGEVYSGSEALGLGLVDALGTLHSVTADRYPDAELVDVTGPVPLLARLLFGRNSSVELGGGGLGAALARGTAEWAVARRAWGRFGLS